MDAITDAQKEALEQLVASIFDWDADEDEHNREVLFGPGATATAILGAHEQREFLALEKLLAPPRPALPQPLTAPAGPAQQQLAAAAGTGIPVVLPGQFGLAEPPAACLPDELFGGSDDSADIYAMQAQLAPPAARGAPHQQQRRQAPAKRRQQAAAGGPADGAGAALLRRSTRLQRQVRGRGAAPLGTGAGREDAGAESEERGPGARRGRPPAVPGVYSKGYAAIKRYRQRKKLRMQEMEAEVQRKRALLASLQAVRLQLQLRHRTLESYISCQDEVLCQLANLQMSLGTQEQPQPPPPPPLPPLEPLPQQQQRRAARTAPLPALSAQQEPGGMMARYVAYITACQALFAQQADSRCSSQSARPTFPGFPWSAYETLSLRRMQSLAPPLPARDNLPVGSELQVNLQTFQLDPVPLAHWRKVSEVVTLTAEHRKQLEEAFAIYCAALAKLNAQRAELHLRLVAAAAGAGASGAASGCGSASASAASSESSRGSEGASATSRPRSGLSCASSEGRLSLGSGQELEAYAELADTIEGNLLRGHAVNQVYLWAMLMSFSRADMARICCAAFPYYPMVRVIIACLLEAPGAGALCPGE